MIKINLLGDALAQGGGAKADAAQDVAIYADEGGRRSLPIAGVVIGLLMASLGGIYYLWLNNEITKKEARQAALQTELDTYKPYFELEARFRKKKEELQNKEQTLIDLRKRQQLPVYFMQELANCLPEDVWFISISQNGMQISVAGQARNFEAINNFYNNLQAKQRWFKKVVYPGATRQGDWLNFTITFELQNAV